MITRSKNYLHFFLSVDFLKNKNSFLNFSKKITYLIIYFYSINLSSKAFDFRATIAYRQCIQQCQLMDLCPKMPAKIKNFINQII